MHIVDFARMSARLFCIDTCGLDAQCKHACSGLINFTNCELGDYLETRPSPPSSGFSASSS